MITGCKLLFSRESTAQLQTAPHVPSPRLPPTQQEQLMDTHQGPLSISGYSNKHLSPLPSLVWAALWKASSLLSSFSLELEWNRLDI